MTTLTDAQTPTTTPVAVEVQTAPATPIAMEETLPTPASPTNPINPPSLDIGKLVELVMAEMSRKTIASTQVATPTTTPPVATASAGSVPNQVDQQPAQAIATPAAKPTTETKPAEVQNTAEPASPYAKMQVQLTMLQNALIQQGKQMACSSLGIDQNSDLATALVNPTLGPNGEILFNGLPMDKFVAVIQATFNRNQQQPSKTSRITIHPNQGNGGWPDSRPDFHELLSAL